MWERAMQALRRNLILATRNAKRQYLLRGLITCGLCGLSYSGCRGVPPHFYYSCNGTRPRRGPDREKCSARFINAEKLEDAIWRDILDFLHDPGPVLDKLATQMQARHAQA